nr:hypothetical protein B0A51_01793 [Rachicladosporium sp. CCFEE 5018]
MATLASDSPSRSPPFHRRRKSWARRIERACCQTLSYFPLLFVYGLTSWAIWVEVKVSILHKHVWVGYFEAVLGIALYGLAVVSYSVAVFTDPGSPLDAREDVAGKRKAGEYEGLPTFETETGEQQAGIASVTAKSSGKQRYCKKCQTLKPDRSHHCSSCGKCVLKMDHHCPWLVTCAGLRNYKPFLLFLIYTSLYCWVCFAVSAGWVWAAIVDNVQMDEGFAVVNTIMLAVIGGIIGIVLSGFTGWHIYLAVTGQTTIESLEKTRYLSPLKENMSQQLRHRSERRYLDQEGGDRDNEELTLTEHLKEIHANALPGVLRPEEGESRLSATPSPGIGSGTESPAHTSMRRSYASMEAQREQDRYDAYLDEQDSEKLPNAFDIGWKRNLLHLFGEVPLLWFLPVCNTTGDGWQWDVSPDWISARDAVSRERTERMSQRTQWQDQPSTAPGFGPPRGRDLRWQPGKGFTAPPQAPPPRMDSNLAFGATPASYASNGMQMQSLDRRQAEESPDGYDTSSDEELRKVHKPQGNTANWNDLPEDFLAPKRGDGRGVRERSRSRGRRKGD